MSYIVTSRQGYQEPSRNKESLYLCLQSTAAATRDSDCTEEVRYNFQITPVHGRHRYKCVHPRGQNHVQLTISKILSKFSIFFF